MPHSQPRQFAVIIETNLIPICKANVIASGSDWNNAYLPVSLLLISPSASHSAGYLPDYLLGTPSPRSDITWSSHGHTALWDSWPGVADKYSDSITDACQRFADVNPVCQGDTTPDIRQRVISIRYIHTPFLPSKHEPLNHCCFNVGPSSKTMVKHLNSVDSIAGCRLSIMLVEHYMIILIRTFYMDWRFLKHVNLPVY